MKFSNKLPAFFAVVPMIFGLVLNINANETTDQNPPYTITINPAEHIKFDDDDKFTAYKLLNIESETGTGDQKVYGYSVAEGFDTFTYTVTSTNGNADKTLNLRTDANINEFLKYLDSIKGSDDAKYDFANAVANFVEEDGSKVYPAVSTESSGSQKITVNSAGYYVILGTGTPQNNAASTVTSAAILLTIPVDKDFSLTIKAAVPEIDKEIVHDVDGNGFRTAQDPKQSTGAIGDVVTYKITTKVPDMTGYKSYTFRVKDTLSKGLDYNKDSLKVTIGNTPVVAKPVSRTESNNVAAYALTVGKKTENGTSITVDFTDFIGFKSQKNDDIVITYSATITGDAVIGNDGNANTVKLVYSNNPRYNGNGIQGENGPDVTGETPESSVTTYVTGVEILKITQGEDGTEIPLNGAIFKMVGSSLNKVVVNNGKTFVAADNGEYYLLNDGTYTTTEPGENADKYVDPDKKYSLVDTTQANSVPMVGSQKVFVGEVDTNGKLVISGLNEGTYTITEIKAPDGYNLLKDSIEFTARWNTVAKTWEFSGNDIDSVNGETTGKLTLKVVNYKGVQLPSTGGMGTTLFYIVGGLMVAASAAMMIMKARNKA